jgi:oxygen-dependent protoporphyrinogen oxidase
MRIAVIGGGLAGLTAAYYVHRQMPNADLCLLESGDRVGGVIETVHRDGWLIEHGADCFSTNPPDALQLCKDLGVDGDLIEPQSTGRYAMISRGDRLYPVPEGFVLMRPTRVWQVLKSPLLSWRGKARLAAERFVGRRTDSADESLAGFVRRRLGHETLDRIVQPLVGGIYTADAELLSMQATMPQFVRMEQQYGSLIGARAGDSAETKSIERETSGARYGQFRVFPEGMNRLFDEMASRLPDDAIRFHCRVNQLRREPTGVWRIDMADQPSIAVDRMILALPSQPCGSLLQPHLPTAASLLQSIPYASSAIVLLGIKTSLLQNCPSAFGFVCPAADRRNILAASFASHKFTGRAPQGYTLIRVFMGGAVQPEILNQPDEALIRTAVDELRRMIGLTGEPEWSSVRRWDRAMPQYHVGHLQRVAEIEREISTLDGVEICGNGLRGVGIAPVVRAARQAAERLIKND